MEMTPEGTPGGSSKRARAKAKVTSKSKSAASEAPAAKKAGAPRKTLTARSAVAAAAAPRPEPSGEELGGMIATAAYYLAAARNFTPGHELDDWLEAERNVRARLYG